VQYALVDRVKYFRRKNGKPKASGSDRRLVVINYYIILSLQYDRDRKEGFGHLGCASGRAHARTVQDCGLSEERLEINLKHEEGGFFSEKITPSQIYRVHRYNSAVRIAGFWFWETNNRKPYSLCVRTTTVSRNS